MALTVTLPAHAQKPQGYAVIASIQGNVEVRPGVGAWSAAKGGESVGQGDAVRTGGSSWAVLDIYEGERLLASVEVKQLSELRVLLLDPDKSILLDLALGEATIKSQRLSSDKARFEVRTKTSFIEVTGKAVFSVAVEKLE